MQKNTSINKKIKKMSYAELSVFCEQLALVIGSGTTVLEVFYILQGELEEGQSKNLYSEIIQHLELGNSLSDTLDKINAFPHYMVQMVKIGEISGRLETVFKSLARYYNREDNLRKFIRNAVAYPLIMVLMMIAVIGVLVVEVMPIFNSVFLQLGGEMTGFSKLLFNIGAWITNNSMILLLFLLLLIIMVFLIVFLPQGRKMLRNGLENFVLTRGLFDAVATAHFAGGMSLMLTSGLDIDESLKRVETLVKNKRLSKKINEIHKKVESGNSFSKAIIEQQIFTGVNSHLLSVGASAGAIDEVMASLSVRYDEEVFRRFENVIAIIEPSIVAVLSIVVGGILLSVMLPLMSIISQMG